MRSLIATTLFILFVISAVGSHPLERLLFEPLGMIRFNEVVRPGDEMIVRVNVQNLGEEELENIQVSVYVLELGLFARSSGFDLDDDEKLVKALLLDIPKSTPPGLYLMQISARGENDIDFRSREFRYFYVI